MPQPGVCSNMVTEETVKLGGKIWISTSNGTCSYQCIFCDCKFADAKSFEQHIPTAHIDQRRPVLRRPPSPPPMPPPQMQVARINVRRESRFEREKNHAGPNGFNQPAAGYRKPDGFTAAAIPATVHRRLSIDLSKRRVSIDANRRRISVDAKKHREMHGKSNGAPPPEPDAQHHRHHRVKGEAEQFKCPRCESRFGTFEVLREHIRRRHFYRCTHCDEGDGKSPKAFETEKGLWNHQRNHHAKHYPYKCDVCVRSFERRQRLKDHMESQHVRGKDVKCDFCTRILMSTFQKKNHIKRSHSNRRYHCQLCKCFVPFYRRIFLNMMPDSDAHEFYYDLLNAGNEYRTTDVDNLKRHTREKHPGQVQP